MFWGLNRCWRKPACQPGRPVSLLAGGTGSASVAGSRVPYFALDFLLNHLAHVHVNFLLFVLPGAFLPGVRLFDPLVTADLHLADTLFFFADSHVVLVGNFFLNVFADANLLHLLFRLADGDLVGVGLCDNLRFVAGVLNFGFYEVRNPNLANGGGGAATADRTAAGGAVFLLATALPGHTAVLDDALFPVTFVFTDFAHLDNRHHVANVTRTAALFFVSDHYGAGHFFFHPDRLADDLDTVALFAGWNKNGVLVVNFFADGLADLAGTGFFNPFGDTDIDDSLFADCFRNADSPLHNFPGTGRFAGNGTGSDTGTAGN